jgi:hypothetical protein
MTLWFGPVPFQYSLAFVIYFFIGWITIVLYSRQNFDEPTYKVSPDEPVSIMIPSFFISQHLYIRGFLIYLISMTGVYFALSLAGQAVVLGIIGVFRDPVLHDAAPLHSQIATETVSAEWPLVLALAMIGLAPKLPGLREPELTLRRFAHKIALIPAYAKYLAAELQRAQFDFNKLPDYRYPPGIQYRQHRA